MLIRADKGGASSFPLTPKHVSHSRHNVVHFLVHVVHIHNITLQAGRVPTSLSGRRTTSPTDTRRSVRCPLPIFDTCIQSRFHVHHNECHVQHILTWHGVMLCHVMFFHPRLPCRMVTNGKLPSPTWKFSLASKTGCIRMRPRRVILLLTSHFLSNVVQRNLNVVLYNVNVAVTYIWLLYSPVQH